MVLTDRNGRETTAYPASGAAMTLSDEKIFAAASRLLPNALLNARLRLVQFDAYWYPHHSERTLPVLRVGFDDAAESWFYIDPLNGDILARIDKVGVRIAGYSMPRIAYFSPLLRFRPVWDIVTVLLSLIGTIVSTSGIVIAWRRLRRRSRWTDARNSRDQSACFVARKCAKA